jgi:hypothetical protein
MLKSSSLCLYSSNLGTFWLNFLSTIAVVTKMATKLKIEKGGMKILLSIAALV